ncbi:MAG: NAD(P)/FAD-dependent oxidoreductase [Hyphomicrobiaceae bacterium]
MPNINRRDLTKLLGGAGLMTALPGLSLAQTNAPAVSGNARPKVVIIGGGAGGGTLAHVLRRGSPEIQVTLIEAQTQYTTCFFSNLYIGGFRSLESLTHGYAGLANIGVNVVTGRAVGIDTAKKEVRLQSGQIIPYDKLAISPGIDFKWGAIPGYTEEASLLMPHAYRGGAQSKLLKDQLAAMPDGGVVVLAPPQNPYRCPPGPYERACMIAHYLKTEKPKSKLIIIDPKKSFSKQTLFMEAFNDLYKGIVELNLSNDIDDQAIKQLDPKTMQIETKAGLKIKANVANIIPPQQAGEIARLAGCTDGDWCPINAENFASTKVQDVYVIGDSSIAGDMPKSAFSANSHAKAVSNDLEAILAGKPKYPSRYRNTCWSMIGPASSVKIGANYGARDGKVTAIGNFISKTGEDSKTREKSLKESQGWYAGMIAEAFNKRVDVI